MSAPPPPPPTRLGVKVAVVLLVALAVVAWLGTLAAARDGIVPTQRRIFDAVWWWQPIGRGWSMPMPGVRLLLLLLFCALVLDPSAWRWRRGQRAVVVVHAGVALLLASGLWSWLATREGSLRLLPGETATRMQVDDRDIDLPFALRFVAARREQHPGTDTLRDLWAEVEVRELTAPAPIRAVRITLNEPLRSHGLTVHLDDVDRLADTARYGETAFRVLCDPGAGARTVALTLLVAGLIAHFVSRLAQAARRGRPRTVGA